MLHILTKFSRFALCLSLPFLVMGCSSTKSEPATQYAEHQHSIVYQEHTPIYRSMEDCTKRIANDMLHDSAFTAKHYTPSLLLGKTTNYTGDDTLPIALLERTMKDVIASSSKVHVVSAHNASKFDYTTHILIEREEHTTRDQYSIRVQLLNYYGELVGQWRANTSVL